MQLFLHCGILHGDGDEPLKNSTKNKHIFFLTLVLLFVGLGSFGTVALANYTNVNISASVVNVRMGPGLSYDIMTQEQGGSSVNVLSEKNEWYKVRLADGRIGWVASWLINNTEVAATSDLLATVIADSVNVRAENSESAEVIGSATTGEKFALLYEENGWSQIQYNNKVAWILSDLIEISPGTIQTAPETADTTATGTTETAGSTVIVTLDGINVRSAPSTTSDVLFVAEKNQEFDLLGQEGEFYLISGQDGTKGYVANWLVELSGSSEKTSTANSTTTLAEATIVIDPGHGGEDPGAEGTYLYEKEVTLSTSEAVAEKLRQAGANVLMTRTKDEYITLQARAALSGSSSADLFISFHYDSTATGTYGTGFTTYYYSDNDIPLANLINKNLGSTLPLQNNGTKFGDFLVIRENTQPSLLLELGYMNNEDDVKTFNSDYYRSLVAESIYQALSDYFQ